MTSSTIVRDVVAWESLDSRGTPTVACEVVLTGGSGRAVVPSGASTGRHEARELRDGGERYGGRGVRAAVASVTGELADAVRGLDAADQDALDHALRAADSSPALARLGSNAVLAVSVAAAAGVASARRLPLWRSVAGEVAGPTLPMPMVNILSGGAHAGRAVDVQDFLVVPLAARSFAEAIEWAWRVRRGTAELVDDAGLGATLVADEGGLGPRLPTNRAALELLVRGMERAGLRPGEDVAVAIDVAATQLVDPGGAGYRLSAENRTVGAEEWLEELAGWCTEFPVVSVEDPLGEDDWSGWALASRRLGGIQLLGDDLFVTDGDRLRRGIEAGIANAVLVKPNQTGTISDARRVVLQARAAGMATVLSARSGETEDCWLADLAVGWSTGQIKVGSTMRSERTAKWNRLLEIEARWGDVVPFAGAGGLALTR